MWEKLIELKKWLLTLDYGELRTPKASDIVLGIVDISRYENPVIISVLPDEEDNADENENDFLDGQGKKLSVTITVLVRGNNQEKLVELVSKYNEVITSAIDNDCELGGLCTGSGMDSRKFYFDAGTVEKQMTAVEIPLTLLYMKS